MPNGDAKVARRVLRKAVEAFSEGLVENGAARVAARFLEGDRRMGRVKNGCNYVRGNKKGWQGR